MKHYTTDKYHIIIYAEKNFVESTNNFVNQYDFVYLEKSEYSCPSILVVKIFQNNTLIKNAIIGSVGGGVAVNDTSIIMENDKIILCCSNTVFCLSIPELYLFWKTKADQATCFEIYKYQDSYIIHGELEISRLDKNGKILWQQSGTDIFTTLNGQDNLVITEDYIVATDWENRKYKFDFNGQLIL